VVAIVRVPKAPLEIMGYRLEAGTQVVPCLYLTHRREDLYPEPTRFDPSASWSGTLTLRVPAVRSG
jgi:cytochrome P450